MKKIYSGISMLAAVCAFSLAHAQTTTFSYTGAVQTYVVPACVTEITIDAQGAQGGGPAGGMGGRAIATVPVTPGSTLYVYVGGQPTTRQGAGSGGFNGGGMVNALPCGGGTTDGWGGGGASDVRTSTALTDRMIVAAGGGGTGWNGGAGGAGGGLQGVDGAANWIAGTMGTGATQSAGGVGGTYNSQYAGNGGFGYGGDAGPVTTYCIGGGGGGGYYGGGGGYVSAGGGGSSWISYPGSMTTSTTAGYRTGDGQLFITPANSGAPASPSSVSGMPALCSGSTSTYSISTVPGATSYTWSVNGGAVIQSGQGTTSITVLFATTSSTISVTADNGCGSSTPTTYSVSINPPPPVVAICGDPIVCTGDSVILYGTGAMTYIWTGNVNNNTPFPPSSSSTYTVTGIDANGCSATDTISIVVLQPVIVTLGPDITQCGGSVNLDAGNATATYLWSESSTTQTITVTNSGTYDVAVTDTNGCIGRDTAVIVINPIPTVTASSAIAMPCLDDDSVALSGTPVGGTWSGPGTFGMMFSPSNAGIGVHTVTYSYTDGNGCSDTAQVNINVDACLGIQDGNNAGAFTLYPNPNNGEFVLYSTVDAAELNITITDVQGRVIYSGTSNNVHQGTVIPVTLGDAANGVYILQVNWNSGQATQRVLIQK